MSHLDRDITSMDTETLREHLKAIKEEVRRRDVEDRIARARSLEGQAQEMGFVSLTEAARTLSGLSFENRPRQVYRNPDNPQQVWSGRGRRPKWVHQYLSRGLPIEEMLQGDAECDPDEPPSPDP